MYRAKSPPTKNITSPLRITPTAKRNAQLMYNLLNQLLFKKKRYTFQVLKQFYLFPEGSSSSVMSVEKYDKLIFNDEAIHTLSKKLETKVLQRKLWAFLNIKLMRILKQVASMSQKMKRVLKRKQTEQISFGFERIKLKAVQTMQKKKRTRDSASQTKIPLQQPKPISRISSTISSSQRLINQTQQHSYIRNQPRVYIHRGSRSRSRSVSPNNSFTRIIRQEQIEVYPQEYRGNVHIHEVTPKMIVTKVTQRSPAKHYYEVDQVKREYRNCYRIAPTRIRVVSCGCEHLLQKSCHCTALVNRLCGCDTCHHSCDGCDKCNCCHSHCSCPHELSNRSISKDKKTIKFIKSPSKKNIEERPPENRNHYLNHLQTASPRGNTFRYEYQQTRVTQIRR